MCLLPKRPEQHIIDEQGILLIQSILEPKHYIFRNLGGRDYGIDGLFEVVENGAPTARMMSIQLKSSTQFPFSTDVRPGIPLITDNQRSIPIDEILGNINVYIKQSTCNYWLQNTLPVFLFLADVTNECLYYTDAKMQLRQRFREFQEKENFAFHVPANSRLYKMRLKKIASKEEIFNAYRHMMFKKCEILALEHPKFFNSIQDFILNRELYYEHIEHQQADPFLNQPIEFYNKTVHIQNILESVSHQLQFELDIINFREVRKKYLGMFKDSYEYGYGYEKVAEAEISELHNRIMSNILKAIEPIKNFVVNTEGDYWKTLQYQVYKEALEMSVEEFKGLCFWTRIKTSNKY